MGWDPCSICASKKAIFTGISHLAYPLDHTTPCSCVCHAFNSVGPITGIRLFWCMQIDRYVLNWGYLWLDLDKRRLHISVNIVRLWKNFGVFMTDATIGLILMGPFVLGIVFVKIKSVWLFSCGENGWAITKSQVEMIFCSFSLALRSLWMSIMWGARLFHQRNAQGLEQWILPEGRQSDKAR